MFSTSRLPFVAFGLLALAGCNRGSANARGDSVADAAASTTSATDAGATGATAKGGPSATLAGVPLATFTLDDVATLTKAMEPLGYVQKGSSPYRFNLDGKSKVVACYQDHPVGFQILAPTAKVAPGTAASIALTIDGISYRNAKVVPIDGGRRLLASGTGDIDATLSRLLDTRAGTFAGTKLASIQKQGTEKSYGRALERALKGQGIVHWLGSDTTWLSDREVCMNVRVNHDPPSADPKSYVETFTDKAGASLDVMIETSKGPGTAEEAKRIVDAVVHES